MSLKYSTTLDDTDYNIAVILLELNQTVEMKAARNDVDTYKSLVWVKMFRNWVCYPVPDELSEGTKLATLVFKGHIFPSSIKNIIGRYWLGLYYFARNETITRKTDAVKTHCLSPINRIPKGMGVDPYSPYYPLCKGYCLNCGEPSRNNFYPRQSEEYNRNLMVHCLRYMGICFVCTSLDYEWNPDTQKVYTPYFIQYEKAVLKLCRNDLKALFPNAPNGIKLLL